MYFIFIKRYCHIRIIYVCLESYSYDCFFIYILWTLNYLEILNYLHLIINSRTDYTFLTSVIGYYTSVSVQLHLCNQCILEEENILARCRSPL